MICVCKSTSLFLVQREKLWYQKIQSIIFYAVIQVLNTQNISWYIQLFNLDLLQVLLCVIRNVMLLSCVVMTLGNRN